MEAAFRRGFRGGFGALAMEAQAGDIYLGFRGGVSLLQDSDMTIEIPGVGQIPAELEFDPGWLAGVAAGFEFDNGFAVEGEFTFRQNGIDQERLMGGIIPIDGFIRSYALMANGYYRLATGTMFTPYIGAGAGGALLSIDADWWAAISATATSPSPTRPWAASPPTSRRGFPPASSTAISPPRSRNSPTAPAAAP